jgi:adenine-specific DNA-methyltransferase
MAKKSNKLTVETLKHEEATRKNIPTVEYQSVIAKEVENPIRISYERGVDGLEEEKQHRNRDLDPQLVWRGKDEQDWSDLVVQAPPLYIQEKVHPKVLIDDLLRRSKADEKAADQQFDLFADFNGLPNETARTEFYQHDANWSNRMILGDSLQVMASLAEREGLRGKVQCIFFDPPYGIKFNSNFQWSTTSRDVTDGKFDHITREPEQVKAFRDTWRNGVHSYLTYLRDRLTLERDLLAESGSIFVQIGDENVHRVRALMDEVFGDRNFISLITTKKSGGMGQAYIDNISDYIIWYAKDATSAKYRAPYNEKYLQEGAGARYRSVQSIDGTIRPLKSTEASGEQSLPEGDRVFLAGPLTSETASDSTLFEFTLKGHKLRPRKGGWKTSAGGMERLFKANRLLKTKEFVNYKIFFNDFAAVAIPNLWEDTMGTAEQNKIYVVQTTSKVIQRCILMTTDPGDLVLDPTGGSGTSAYVSEQWGRRWISIDTSRVAMALARARIMGARYSYYLLADSPEGQFKEAEVTRTTLSSRPTRGDIRQGFVYERVPHITLKSIANNAEIDVIWEKFQEKLEPLRQKLNKALGRNWEEWEVPRELSDVIPGGRLCQPSEETSGGSRAKAGRKDKDWTPASAGVTAEVERLHSQWWQQRIARQKEIDASIAAKAEFEYLYDKPYDAKKTVRVAGPFTVESLSPHRVLGVDENDELIDSLADSKLGYGEKQDFAQMILENLKTAGVQQAHKEDKIVFTSLTPWPGELICAEGRFEGSGEWIVKSGEHKSQLTTNNSPLVTEYRAAIFIGPEFGTVSRPDLVAAAREAGDGGFDVLITCAFNYDAPSTEFNKLGRIPVLKARMNADLHMADDLKNTGKGNLFVIFGEPDISVASEEWLVDSTGRRIAPYDIFKLVSGVGSLAEINRLGREDLFDYAKLSCRGEIWDYLTNAAGGDIHSGKYSRRSGSSEYEGVSAVAWHCAGIAGGIGNVSDLIRKLGVSGDVGFRELIEGLRRDQQNAKRFDQIALHSPLTTNHYFQLKVNGVDVFHPTTGEVRSDGAEGIACWFIDTDYNEESFFVRHAYFLGANDPYKSLKTTLKTEINEEAWATLNSDTSRPFDKPTSGRIAVKVINHLGDEVMKVFKVT